MGKTYVRRFVDLIIQTDTQQLKEGFSVGINVSLDVFLKEVKNFYNYDVS